MSNLTYIDWVHEATLVWPFPLYVSRATLPEGNMSEAGSWAKMERG